MIFEHGGALPYRAEVLIAAETWGCPPWEVSGRDSPAERLRWFLYWRVFQSKRNKARR